MKIPTISDRDWLSRLVHIQFVPPTFYFNNVYFESNGWKSWRRFSEETQRRWNIVRRTMKFENKTLEDNFHSCIERWSMLIHWWIQLKILSQIKKNERISHTWRSSMKKTFCSANRTKRILRISKLNDRDMMKNICQGKFGKKYSRIGRNGRNAANERTFRHRLLERHGWMGRARISARSTCGRWHVWQHSGVSSNVETE